MFVRDQFIMDTYAFTRKKDRKGVKEKGILPPKKYQGEEDSLSSLFFVVIFFLLFFVILARNCCDKVVMEYHFPMFAKFAGFVEIIHFSYISQDILILQEQKNTKLLPKPVLSFFIFPECGSNRIKKYHQRNN